jgi:hypothetical protein
VNLVGSAVTVVGFLLTFERDGDAVENEFPSGRECFQVLVLEALGEIG